MVQIQVSSMKEFITLNHGSGGRQMHSLISQLFVTRFGMAEPLSDSAVFQLAGSIAALTTDSFVVDPIFFPGGDIGKMAVCGTVNDLAVSGARPVCLSASFIIEEGFPYADLEKIVESMAREAENAGVRIVTGDTKVVGKGKCDKLFITTSGMGVVNQDNEHLSTGRRIAEGDILIVNGPLGNHAMAILAARNKMNFTLPVVSDCASLNHLINKLLDNCPGIHFMRDLTRGGLASVLNEVAEMTKTGMMVTEAFIPVDEPVRGLCEILGFDPLYLANEGKFLLVATPSEEEKILGILRSDELGERSAVIGTVSQVRNNMVILNTTAGGRRILDMPSGMLLPRIC
jgi:hydrogenase expression/formation protein HypE